ncbi:hypothetical protein RFI_18131, partial [Reticulomyxa filosa]
SSSSSSSSSSGTVPTLNFDRFRSSSKSLKTFISHTEAVYSIDNALFDDSQFICSGSKDKTVRVWDIETNKQIQLFKGHSDYVRCVKFSLYHYYNHRRHIICSSSLDKTIRFWDIKHNQHLQLLNQHKGWVGGIDFSSFNGGRYLCSGSGDNTIRLWDVETSKSLHVFNGHEYGVECVVFSPLQSNSNNNNQSKNIGVIGGSGYTICSGSDDKTIRIWDIETNKRHIVFKGHENMVRSIKYGPNGLVNTILSGSMDKSIRLWDIRSGKQIQVFNGHKSYVYTVEYSPFEVDNNEFCGILNTICSGSTDNTIRFWDIRLNKKELYVIKGDKIEDNGIYCFKFLSLKKKDENEINCDCDINLCYGSRNGPIRIWR